MKRRIILLFLLMLFSVLLIGLKTYSYDDIFLFDDLKVDDFIPNKATILTDYDYHDASMNYEEEVYLCYTAAVGDEDNVDYRGLPRNSCYKVENNSKVIVSTYQEVFESDKYKFNGWVVSSTRSNYVYLEPADEGFHIEIKPDKTNNYTLEGYCASGNYATNKWYKYVDVNKTDIGNDSVWEYKDDVLILNEFSLKDDDYEEKLTFNFKAAKNDILYFESKLFFRPYYGSVDEKDELLIYLDGEEIILDESDFYQKNYYVIEDDGEHILELHFKKNNGKFSYVHLRNLRILTYLGDADSLDITNLNNEDQIYYEVYCDDYVMSGETIVVKDVVPEIDQDLDDDNPETSDSFYKYILFSSILLVIVIILLWRRKYTRL